MPFEPKSPTIVKKMKKGEMFEHISELFNVVDLMIISSSSRRLHAWRAQSMCTRYVHISVRSAVKLHPRGCRLWRRRRAGLRGSGARAPEGFASSLLGGSVGRRPLS